MLRVQTLAGSSPASSARLLFVEYNRAMKEGIYKTMREFETKMFPNAVLDRLQREWMLKGWRVRLHRYKEDKKSGRIEIQEKVDEEMVWEEVEKFYTTEGYEVRRGEEKGPRLELRKNGDVYWVVVLPREQETDVYIFRSPMIRIEEGLKQIRLGLVEAK